MDRKRLHWTSEEAKVLLNRVLEWWPAKREEAQRIASGATLLSLSSKGIAVPLVAAALAQAVLPTLDPRSPLWKKVEGLLDELREINLESGPAVPWLLRGGADPGEVAERLRQELNQVGEERFVGAVDGLITWVYLAESADWPAPPEDLMDAVVYAVGGRQAGFIRATRTLARLVHDLPKTLNARQRGRLLAALRYTLKHTAPPDPEHALIDTAAAIEDELTEERAAEAELAGALTHTVGRPGADSELKSVLDDWRIACETSTLPEVRAGWERYSVE